MTWQKRREGGTVKGTLARLVEQVGGVERAMARLQLGRSRVYAITDPDDAQQASFAQVAALTDAEGTAAAEFLAALAGGAFLPLPKGGGALPELTAETARAFGNLMAELVRDLADGKVTPAEARRARARLGEVLRAAAAIRAELDAIAATEKEDGA